MHSSSVNKVVAGVSLSTQATGALPPVYITTPIYYVNDKPHIGCVLRDNFFNLVSLL